jgi:hypothetical protein
MVARYKMKNCVGFCWIRAKISTYGRINMAMTVEIKGNKLCIEIDLETPTPSSSGKTLVVASSRGNAVTTAMVDGKPITIGLNAYIKK